MTGPLADQVRARLAHENDVREVRMFGSLAFMVDDRMLVAARDDELLVRCDPARHAELLTHPGARQAEMGTGRSMGEGWITVSPDALSTEDQLGAWLAVAREYHAAGR